MRVHMTSTDHLQRESPPDLPPDTRSLAAVFLTALKLGLTSFGGPIAHLGYFREEYVVRRRWLDERSYADLVALCQVLPGPASSQVGIGIGTMLAGIPGGIAAWLGFTLPSAIALTIFALVVGRVDISEAGWVHGLTIVAVPVVAQAVWGMAQRFCADRLRATVAILAAIAALAAPTAFAQLAIILAAGLIGWRFIPSGPLADAGRPRLLVSRRVGVICLTLLFAGLLGATLRIDGTDSANGGLDLIASFFRVGSLVFGGGHVVLPLIEADVVPGWLSEERFLAGYGAAQAVPGPLFTFASYLGAVREPAPSGVIGATLATTAIFLPAFLLIFGTLPFWEMIRVNPMVQRALSGINAAVVGILLAALYTPIWTSTILGPDDLGLALVCGGLLMIWRWPPPAVVLVAAIGGEILGRL